MKRYRLTYSSRGDDALRRDTSLVKWHESKKSNSYGGVHGELDGWSGPLPRTAAAGN